MDDFFTGAFFVGILALASLMGALFNDSVWEKDCTKLGKTVSSGVVYECHREKKEEKK